MLDMSQDKKILDLKVIQSQKSEVAGHDWTYKSSVM